jgi:hypothetical protein
LDYKTKMGLLGKKLDFEEMFLYDRQGNRKYNNWKMEGKR